MKESLFSYNSYKQYINDRLDDETDEFGGRGARSRLSVAIGCQSAFVAQVFKGAAHLSLEQAEQINLYFNHTENESQFFLFLVQYLRAGTEVLRRRIKSQLVQLQNENLDLKNRLESSKKISEVNMMTYYSSWLYGAVHILIMIPEFQSIGNLSKRLQVPQKNISVILEFLIRCGLAQKVDGRYQAAETKFHLPADSPLSRLNHINWRMRAIQSLESGQSASEELHFSAMVTLSESDIQKIREILVKSIEKSIKVIKTSPEETARVICIDFFNP